MNVVRELSELRPEPTVVTAGNYDGVHIGHRALLRQVVEEARSRGLRSVALTFDPHPLTVVAQTDPPPALCTPSRRAELLLREGVTWVVMQTFDATFAAQSAEDFATNVLRKQLGAEVVVVGPDFRFGARREGDAALLRRMGERLQIETQVVAPVVLEGSAVSSSRIRSCIQAGATGEASHLLGRVHEVHGVVVRGHERGRLLGFPTANLECEPTLIPKEGVYAAVVRPMTEPRRLLPAVVNIGLRPTFAADWSVEAHLLDFNESLYGQTLRVGFVDRIRDVRKFDGPEALKQQISADIVDARRRLKDAGSWLCDRM